MILYLSHQRLLFESFKRLFVVYAAKYDGTNIYLWHFFCYHKDVMKGFLPWCLLRTANYHSFRMIPLCAPIKISNHSTLSVVPNRICDLTSQSIPFTLSLQLLVSICSPESKIVLHMCVCVRVYARVCVSRARVCVRFPQWCLFTGFQVWETDRVSFLNFGSV